MLFQFMPAAIQTVANFVGHVPGTDEPCLAMGPIVCVVRFGSRDVDYLTYLYVSASNKGRPRRGAARGLAKGTTRLYLNSITKGLSAVACILASGLADYSHFRKHMMMGSIYLFGILSLPLAGLTSATYGTLTTLSALYVVSTVVMAVFMIIQASYIPIFMATALGPSTNAVAAAEPGEKLSRSSWARGARVSTWGIVVNYIGQIAAVLAGLIIAYTQIPSPDASLKRFAAPPPPPSFSLQTRRVH